MRVVVGITGATGAIFGIRILQALRELDVRTELILTKWARVTIQHETEFTASEVEALATETHSNSNLAASISSGSFTTDGIQFGLETPNAARWHGLRQLDPAGKRLKT